MSETLKERLIAVLREAKYDNETIFWNLDGRSRQEYENREDNITALIIELENAS